MTYDLRNLAILIGSGLIIGTIAALLGHWPPAANGLCAGAGVMLGLYLRQR